MDARQSTRFSTRPTTPKFVLVIGSITVLAAAIVGVFPTNGYGGDYGSPTATDWARAREALETRVTINMPQTTLQEAVAALSRSVGYPMVLDTIGLDDIGIAGDTPATMEATDVRLETALSLLLRDLELTWTISHEMILITTQQESESSLITIVHPVADMLPQSDQHHDAMDSMMDMIINSIEVDSWSHVGGPGSIEGSVWTGSLVISQTGPVHREIERLLDNLRHHNVGLGSNNAASFSSARGNASSGQSQRYQPRRRSPQH